MSKYGVRFCPCEDGSFILHYDDTPYGRALQRHAAPVGSALRQTYVAVYDKNHNRQFVKDKKIDQYARIQSFKDQCLIENIIRRCAGGDYSGLSKARGMYGDFTQMPSDLRSVHDLLIRARSIFDGLNEEEKQRDFAGSFENFLGTFGDDQTLARYIDSKRVVEKTEEVVPDGKE